MYVYIYNIYNIYIYYIIYEKDMSRSVLVHSFLRHYALSSMRWGVPICMIVAWLRTASRQV